MEQSFVVCHMLTSLDGKIDGDFFKSPETAPASKAYGELRGYFKCQATLYGTTTMLGSYAQGRAPDLPKSGSDAPFEDFVSPEGLALGNYIISVDPDGILGFDSHIIEKKGRPPAHVIEVLTEKTDRSYVEYLKSLGISYVFAGEKSIDFTALLGKLRENFEICRLIVAGGGTVNWSLLSEGLIDELSIVITPVADGSTTFVSIFERADFLPPHGPVPFALIEAKPLGDDVLWLRYKAKK